MYCAIIGDIINSKTIVDRYSAQVKIINVLTEVNKKNDNFIASAFTLTLGDEFQGLLLSPVKAFEIIEFIQRKINPIRIRFGIGAGDITTPIDRSISIGADGPAFYYAREMINEMKEKIKLIKTEQTEILFSSKSYEDLLINATANLYRDIERKWSNEQREKIYYHIETEENQRSIASSFNVSQSSINRAFKNSNFYNYMFALNQINEFLNKKYGEVNADANK